MSKFNLEENITVNPCLKIYINKLRHNVKIINDYCKHSGVDVVGITKVSNGSKEIAQAMIDGGIKIIGDSRIENLKEYYDLPAKKMLIRLPMLSEIGSLVKYADISLNTELKVIKAIAKEAQKVNKVHEIILMIEAGDLREGIYDKEELIQIVEEATLYSNIRITGIGANFNCFGSIKPTTNNIGMLIGLKNDIKQSTGIELSIISGGNSGSIALIQKSIMPKEINQLRIGTTFLVGVIENSIPRFPNVFTDIFILDAEIIEIKTKPSMPFGEKGFDAFRNKPVYKDKGLRKRAICAIGKQDCEPQFMYPLNKNIEIIGSSSDHIIMDITDSRHNYEVGDTIEFILDYVSILRCMTSKHVRKIYIGESNLNNMTGGI